MAKGFKKLPVFATHITLIREMDDDGITTGREFTLIMLEIKSVPKHLEFNVKIATSERKFISDGYYRLKSGKIMKVVGNCFYGHG